MEINSNKYVVKATRRVNAEMPINLSRRRNWYDGTSETTETTTIETPAPETPNADTGTSNTGEQDKSKMVQMPQSDLDRLMADRAGQAKRNAVSDLLKTLGVPDVTTLTSMAESHKQAEEEKTAAEEAQKSELQKRDEQLASSVSVQTTQAQQINDLLIKVAVMETAPSKEIAAVYFGDLLTLMDKNSITITDGVVDRQTVEAAIDATLEGRDYLKVQATNGRTPGSPPSKKMLPQQQQKEKPEPVQRGFRPSM